MSKVFILRFIAGGQDLWVPEVFATVEAAKASALASIAEIENDKEDDDGWRTALDWSGGFPSSLWVAEAGGGELIIMQANDNR